MYSVGSIFIGILSMVQSSVSMSNAYPMALMSEMHWRLLREPVFSIHPETPQGRLINQAVEILQSGGVIAYPTDSAYALGCLLDNKSGAERIKQIRKLEDDHNFTLVCRTYRSCRVTRGSIMRRTGK